MKRIRSIAELAELGIIKALDADLERVERQFATAISKEMMANMTKDPQDPLYLQFVPSDKELDVRADELRDPIGDDAHSPVKGLVHRHRDRVLLMPVNVCAVYCRFCFRREKIGPGVKAMTPDELTAAINYIENHPEIREVILTGGDPLMLKPKSLHALFSQLRAIDHVDVVRIHTRIPVVEPERIDGAMLNVLAQFDPLYIVIHANSANEFTESAKHACVALRKQGCVMLSQSVLLKGVNDTLETLGALMRQFVVLGIKPYYLHQLDKARGTSHFEVDIANGCELVRALREHYSGLCSLTYVQDEVGGTGGKRPLPI